MHPTWATSAIEEHNFSLKTLISDFAKGKVSCGDLEEFREAIQYLEEDVEADIKYYENYQQKPSESKT